MRNGLIAFAIFQAISVWAVVGGALESGLASDFFYGIAGSLILGMMLSFTPTFIISYFIYTTKTSKAKAL